jgi:hypothetical protein
VNAGDKVAQLVVAAVAADGFGIPNIALVVLGPGGDRLTVGPVFGIQIVLSEGMSPDTQNQRLDSRVRCHFYCILPGHAAIEVKLVEPWHVRRRVAGRYDALCFPN